MSQHSNKIVSLIVITAALLFASFTSLVVSAAEEVNVYSYRQPFLVKPLFDKFTDETGIKVNVVFASIYFHGIFMLKL